MNCLCLANFKVRLFIYPPPPKTADTSPPDEYGDTLPNASDGAKAGRLRKDFAPWYLLFLDTVSGHSAVVPLSGTKAG